MNKNDVCCAEYSKRIKSLGIEEFSKAYWGWDSSWGTFTDFYSVPKFLRKVRDTSVRFENCANAYDEDELWHLLSKHGIDKRMEKADLLALLLIKILETKVEPTTANTKTNVRADHA